jgi:hypothetical protein
MSTKWDKGFAMEFKNRENPDYVGTTIATVISVNPLTISIYDGAATFSGEDLIVSKECTEYTMQVTVNVGGGTYTGTAKHEGLKVGDSVIVSASENNQEYFLIGKVGD